MNTLPQFSAPNTGALRFSDVDGDSVTVAHDAALSAANWTVEAWVTTTNTDGDFNRVVTKAVGGGQTYSIVVINGEAQIRSSVGVITSTGITVADGEPHHIAGVYDSVSDTLALYVDGALISSISTAGQTLSQGTEDVFIGDYPAPFVEAFDGDISDVRIWSDVRTTEEIAATFDQSLDGGAPNLELHLRFDGDATDSSGNGRDGVINGSPVFVEGLAPVDPLVFDPMTLAATEDVAEAITGLQVSDADPGAVLTVMLEAASGALTLATTTGLTFTAGGNGSATFTAQGTVADLNAALATLSYLGDPDFNGADNIVLTVDDGQADVVEPVSGSIVIPNAGIFAIFDFDSGIGSVEFRNGNSTPVTAPTNGVYIFINPNNSNWGAAATLMEDGVASALPPTFDLIGYTGGFSTSATSISFQDAFNGLTLTYTNEDTPTPTGARDIAFTFNGLDFTDAFPGNMNLDDADFRMSSEAVVEIPVTVASVVDAAPVITQAQATGEVFEPEADAKVGFEIDDFDQLDGTNGFNINGQAAEERLGNSVAGLGDVNGDGFDDFIVGVYGADPGGLTNVGAAHIVFGDAGGVPANLDVSTLDGLNGFTFNGVEGSDSVGASVDGIGDINSDGFDDIIIGARGASEVFSYGEAYVVYGKASGSASSLTAADLDGVTGATVGGVSFSSFGGSVSGAGDVNGDGIDDLIVGAQVRATAAGSQAGATYIVFGQTGGLGASVDVTTLSGPNGFKIEGVNAGDRLGISVDGGGDFNGDGFDDLLIGAYRASSNGLSLNGAAYVVFGAPGGFDGEFDLNSIDGTNGFIMEGNADTLRLGREIGVIGDVNNDGLDDFAIGSTETSPNGVLVAGQVYVVFGQSAGGFPSNLDLYSLDGTDGFTINGIAQGDRIGEDVTAAGDLNADGIDDFIIGAQDQAFVIFGNAAGFGATLELSSLDGQNGVRIDDGINGSAVGRAVAGIGDFNGDGIDDIIAGDRVATINGDSAAGRAATVFGASENAAASGEIQFQNGASRDSHTVSSGETTGTGLGVFTAEIVDAHDPGGLGVVEWNFLISAAELDPLAAGETIVQTYDVTIANPDASVVQQITVTINGANDTPVTIDDAFTTYEETVLSGDLLTDNGFGPDFDIDNGATLTVTEIDGVAVNDGDVVTLASGANLTIRADGTFDYDPTAAFDPLADGEPGADSFTYTITDDQGASSTAIASFAITGVNDAPVAIDDAFTTDEETVLSGDLLTDNGFGPDFDIDDAATLTVTEIDGVAVNDGDVVTLASGANLTIRADGTFDYDPTAAFDPLADGEPGADSFTYTITDDQGASSTAIASFAITGVNDAPIAVDDNITTDEDSIVSGDLLADNFFGPDTDPDSGTILGVTEIEGIPVFDGEVVPLASGALLTIRTNGTFDYDPNGAFEALAEGQTATESFTYTITDDFSASSTATGFVTVFGVNDAPTAFDDNIATDEETVFSGSLFADNGLGADIDVENGSTINVFEINGAPVTDGQAVTLASGAILTIWADGTFDYDPNGAFEQLAQGDSQPDTFAYTIADEFGAAATATAFVTVSGVNDAPVAADDDFSTDQDNIVAGDLFADNFFGPDIDPDNGALLNVTEINGTPVFDGEPVVLSSGAILLIRTDGTFDYDPNGAFDSLPEGMTAPDSFTYTVVDEFGATSIATANVTVFGMNDAPQAFDETYNLDEDTPLSDGLLFDANSDGFVSFDPDGDPLSISQINGVGISNGDFLTLASGAVLTIRTDGTFDYDPLEQFQTLGAGATGTDSFTFQVDDGLGGVTTATALLNIAGINDAPTAQDDNLAGNEDAPIVGNLFADNGFGADADIDAGDTLTVTRIDGALVSNGQTVSLASGAALTIGSNGSFTYDQQGIFDQLSEGSATIDTFTYEIDDGLGGVSTATASLVIEGVNDLPTAANDEISVNEDAPVSGDLLADNGFGIDDDPESGNFLTVTEINGAPVNNGQIITLASGANLTIRADGTFDYDPAGVFENLAVGAQASDDFTYTVADELGATATATAIVMINGANDAPAALPDDFTTVSDTPVSGDLKADNGFGADLDIDVGDILSVTAINGQTIMDGKVVTLPSGANLTIRVDGTFDYDPAGAFDALRDGEFVNETFIYTLSDGQGGTSDTTAGLFVTGVNNPPVAANDAFVGAEDTGFSGDVIVDNGFGADTDPDIGDILSVTEINGAAIADGAPISLPSGAVLTFRTDGTFDYDPAGAFEALAGGAFGADNFTYALSDEIDATSQATVEIAIIGANDAPLVANDAFEATEQTGFSGDVTDDNGFGVDADPDTGDALSVTEINGSAITDGAAITLPSGAILTVRTDGAFDYDPAGAFNALAVGAFGADSFAYTLSDGAGGVSAGTVDIAVEGVNEPPVARDDVFTVAENSSISGNFFSDNRFGADTDGDDDALSIVQIADLFPSPDGTPITATLGSGAEVTFSADGAFTYEAGSAFDVLGVGEVAIDQFTYLASDQQGGIGAAIATFTVTGANDAPLAHDDAFSTDEDTAIGGLFLLADNGAGADTDQDGDRLSLASIDGVGVGAGDTVLLTSGAAVSVGVGGEVFYDPNGAFEALESGEAATDSFVYQTIDGQGGVSEATVRVEIAGVSDILFGTADIDVLEGTAGDDEIRALDGGDFVSGFAGNDIIDGGAGNDRARGGEGNDSITGGDGDDALFGESGDDVLAGGDGADRLRGQRGDDRLLGQNGDDVLAGARGEDTLIGGAGNDTLAGGGENDHLRGQAGDDKLGGSRGDDSLQGGTGADRISGGAGNDTLVGGKDDDTLIGGAGEDVFQFARNDGSDTIRRFQQDADLIRITSDEISFEDLSIVQQGANVLISFAACDLLVTAQSNADFSVEDFIFFG